MKLLHNKTDSEAYNFKNTKKRPVSFPCIVWDVNCEGGIGGDYDYTYIHYITTNEKEIDLESYFLGFKAAKTYGNGSYDV